MQFLREGVENVQIIQEASENGTKSLFVEGPALIANSKNKNGRVYPKNVLSESVANYIKEYLEDGRAVGELGHPDTPNVQLHNISHKFITIKEDGDSYIAKSKITTETPMGKIAKALLDENVKLGYSSRGMGDVRKNSQNIFEVQPGFRITTAADLVADPSAPGAFVKGIMENFDWYYDASSGTWAQKTLEPLREELKAATISEINERKLRLFESYMSLLSKKI